MKIVFVIVALLVCANQISSETEGEKANDPSARSRCKKRCPPGPAGPQGPQGDPGSPGTLRRWKQCTWTYDLNKDGRDIGQIHECDFQKSKADSYLRVVYMGNIRITGCEHCCSRWYFTFNNAECQNPAPIDGALYKGQTARDLNIHRPANIEGYCGGIPAGNVRVGFSVGSCGGNLPTANAFTSWNQASRIIIEEVEPPVA